ncbi:hypothetical protein KR51_00001810 [Rubidibacter lacunae KORDI 51-2]|uniref:Uncharacterized protein n=1 Tax=Rubidibacter lacunae KORDI 51-2 TaxID=582515 RepID=U5DMI6_9CHRO|nr:hypothetical protein [Rubidibacter lacunae]ERN42886.1 hypothetical protein KR51_00001810 [Rubidibacter lacunae KORDI 51-2]
MARLSQMASLTSAYFAAGALLASGTAPLLPVIEAGSTEALDSFCALDTPLAGTSVFSETGAAWGELPFDWSQPFSFIADRFWPQSASSRHVSVLEEAKGTVVAIGDRAIVRLRDRTEAATVAQQLAAAVASPDFASIRVRPGFVAGKPGVMAGDLPLFSIDPLALAASDPTVPVERLAFEWTNAVRTGLGARPLGWVVARQWLDERANNLPMSGFASWYGPGHGKVRPALDADAGKIYNRLAVMPSLPAKVRAEKAQSEKFQPEVKQPQTEILPDGPLQEPLASAGQSADGDALAEATSCLDGIEFEMLPSKAIVLQVEPPAAGDNLEASSDEIEDAVE